MLTDVPSILQSRHLGANPIMMKVVIIICLMLVTLAIYQAYHRPRTTKFRGPPSKSFLFGVIKDLFGSPDLGGIYGNWEKTYGPVYEIPSILGSSILVLQDPKAVTDLFSKDTTTYHQIRLAKVIFRNIMMVSFFDGSCKAILSRPFNGRPVMYW